MRQRPTPCCNAWGSRGHCNVKYVSSGVKKKTNEDDVCFRFSICFPYSYISENSQRSLFPGLRALIFCLGYMNTTHRGLLPAREFHISPEISLTVKKRYPPKRCSRGLDHPGYPRDSCAPAVAAPGRHGTPDFLCDSAVCWPREGPASCRPVLLAPR